MRIAMFNLENLDDETGQDPSLATRVAIMRPQLDRIAADILCLHARGSGFASSSTSRWSWCPAAPNPSSPTNPWPHSAAGCRGRPSVPGPSTTLATSSSQRDQPHWTAGGGQGRAHRRAALPAPLLCHQEAGLPARQHQRPMVRPWPVRRLRGPRPLPRRPRRRRGQATDQGTAGAAKKRTASIPHDHLEPTMTAHARRQAGGDGEANAIYHNKGRLRPSAAPGCYGASCSSGWA